MFEMKI